MASTNNTGWGRGVATPRSTAHGATAVTEPLGARGPAEARPRAPPHVPHRPSDTLDTLWQTGRAAGNGAPPPRPTGRASGLSGEDRGKPQTRPPPAAGRRGGPTAQKHARRAGPGLGPGRKGTRCRLFAHHRCPGRPPPPCRTEPTEAGPPAGHAGGTSRSTPRPDQRAASRSIVATLLSRLLTGSSFALLSLSLAAFSGSFLALLSLGLLRILSLSLASPTVPTFPWAGREPGPSHATRPG